MLDLFIFKSSSRGMQYGIGTYIRELAGSLLKSGELRIILVSYRSSEYKEVTFRQESERFGKIDIPAVMFHSALTRDAETKYASAVIRILSEYIPETGNIIFQMNYIDDLPIAKKLKEKYPYPVISMVHFAQYQQLFNGNRKKLTGLNFDNPSNNIEFTLSTEKQFYEVSDYIVSVTGYMKDFLIHYYKAYPDKISVIPNGLELSAFESVSDEEKIRIRHDLGFEKDDIICLFSGRIDRCKGVGFLLPAFEEACRKADNLKLVLLGQGNLQEFQSTIKSSFGKITFTGFLLKEQVKMFYQVADIGVIPSVYDHCPYTALEMIASGVPLIMSRIEGLNEILEDSECVFIDPATDESGEIGFNISELSRLILRLSWDESLRRRLSENALRKLLSRNTAKAMAYSMEKIFRKILTVQKSAMPL